MRIPITVLQYFLATTCLIVSAFAAHSQQSDLTWENLSPSQQQMLIDYGHERLQELYPEETWSLRNPWTGALANFIGQNCLEIDILYEKNSDFVAISFGKRNSLVWVNAEVLKQEGRTFIAGIEIFPFIDKAPKWGQDQILYRVHYVEILLSEMEQKALKARPIRQEDFNRHGKEIVSFNSLLIEPIDVRRFLPDFKESENMALLIARAFNGL